MSIADRIAPRLTNTGDYPATLRGYVGQDAARELLRLKARSARARKARMEHTLITHPEAGIGKTALAHSVAGELGRPVRRFAGRMKVDLARMLFAEMKPLEVLFYDEFHTIMDNGKKEADWWLTFLQDGYLPGPRGREEIPPITVIGATTEAQLITKAIRDRFLIPPMGDYTSAEAAKIVTTLSGRILDGPKVTGKDALAIATACHSNPRQMHHMLTLLRDMVVDNRMPNGYDIPMLLEFQDISPDGLDNQARRYLTVLAHEFDGQAGGANLGDRLGGQIEDTERVLMARGYITKTRTGRRLTREGIVRCQTLEEAS